MRKGIFERAYLNWHYRKDILMKDISERAFPKGHFDEGHLKEGHFEGRAFPKGERAKGMKGIVHELEFSRFLMVFHDILRQISKYCFGAISSRELSFYAFFQLCSQAYQCKIL